MAQAGLPKVDERGQEIDIHALRHTFSTRLVRNGVGLSATLTQRLALEAGLAPDPATPGFLNRGSQVRVLPGAPAYRWHTFDVTAIAVVERSQQ